MGERLPYYFEKLSPEDDELVKSNFGASGFVRDLGNENRSIVFLFCSPVRLRDRDGHHLQTVTQRFQDHAELIYNMEVRKDDVWVVTYPKCGTTWTQEILWNIVNGVQVERIKEPIRGRSPFLDIPMLEDSPDRNPVEFFNNIDKVPSPRVIKVTNIYI